MDEVIQHTLTPELDSHHMLHQRSAGPSTKDHQPDLSPPVRFQRAVHFASVISQRSDTSSATSQYSDSSSTSSHRSDISSASTLRPEAPTAKDGHRSKDKGKGVGGAAKRRPQEDSSVSVSSDRSGTSVVKKEGDSREHRKSKESKSKKLMNGLEEEITCPICMSVM